MASDNEEAPVAQRQALWWALVAYVLFLVLYVFVKDVPFIHIHEQADKWGQFGDYVGGVINPVVGLITIWLLTASLKQSQEEMKSTRKALEAAEKSQKATELAMRDQLKVSEHTRDMNSAQALYEHRTMLIRAYKENRHRLVYTEAELPIVNAEIIRLEEEREGLSTILDKEVHRLFTAHPEHKNQKTQSAPNLHH